MKLLRKEKQESYENAKFYYICTEKFEDKYAKDKKYCKVRYHCHYASKYKGAAYSICNLKYSIPKETVIILHNGSNYVCHFITKELEQKFKGQFSCLGENTEIYINFSVQIGKEVKIIGKNGEEIKKAISCRLQFIDSARFMASSLSNPVNKLAHGIQKIKCKFQLDNEKCETCRIKYKDRECYLEYTNVKDDLIEY